MLYDDEITDIYIYTNHDSVLQLQTSSSIVIMPYSHTLPPGVDLGFEVDLAPDLDQARCPLPTTPKTQRYSIERGVSPRT
jgi:hypothetical protein